MSKKRNLQLMFGVWLICAIDWIIFTVSNIILNDRRDYETLWDFNFFQMVFSSLIMILATIFFGISFRRIKLLSLTHDFNKNRKLLHSLRVVDGLFFFQSIFMSVILLLQLGAQGYYGPYA